MSRGRYLIVYGIPDDRRLRSVATCMEAYGTRIQYSMFIGDLPSQTSNPHARRRR
jgi:CRISPR-associated protein Cas2